MNEVKYKIRRAILMAAAEFAVFSFEFIWHHPWVSDLGVEVEAVRDQWKLLIRHGYIKLIPGYVDDAVLADEQKKSIEKTCHPTRDEFLWGAIVAVEGNKI